jgi:hypothetical protein
VSAAPVRMWMPAMRAAVRIRMIDRCDSERPGRAR